MNRPTRFVFPVAAVAATILAASTASATFVGIPAITGNAPAFSGSFLPANTTDGTAAEYASNNQGTNTFIQYNFGSPVTFDRVIMITRQSAATSDLFSLVKLTYDAGSDTIATNSSVAVSNVYDVGSTTTQTVLWEVDALASGGTTGNTGMTEIIFLNTPAGTETVKGVTAYNGSTPFNANYAVSNAADGLVGNAAGAEYASAGQGTNTFVDFDLGAVKAITGFDYIDRLSAPDWVASYSLIFSNASNFSSIIATQNHTKTGLVGSGNYTAPIEARYVRLDVTGLAGVSLNNGVTEMIFYAIVPEPATASLGLLALTTLMMRRRRNV